MSLQKQIVSVNFTGGVDTKTDDKLVVSTKLSELNNGVFKKTGRISKRYGYDLLSKDVKNELSEITQGQALSVLANELTMFSQDRLYSYSDSVSGWIGKGDVKSIQLSNDAIVKNSYNQSNPTSATNGTTQLFAWEDSSGGVRASVYDYSSKSIIVNNVEISTTGSHPKCLISGDFLIVFYIEGTSLLFKTVSKFTPTQFSAGIVVTGDLNMSERYDCAVLDNRLFVAYHNDSVFGETSIRYIDLNPFTVSAATTLNEGCAHGVSIAVNEGIYVSILNGTKLLMQKLFFNLNKDGTLIEVRSVVGPSNLATAYLDNTIYIQQDFPAVDPNNTYIELGKYPLGGAYEALTTLRSVGLSGNSFVYNSEVFVPISHSSDLQSTGFVANAVTGTIIAKIQPTLFGPHITNGMLSNVSEVAPGVFTLPIAEKAQLNSDEDGLFTLNGVSSVTLDFISNNRYQTADMGGLHILGGVNNFYDGAVVVEEGFSLYPEGVTGSATDDPAGPFDVGSYSYSVCYEWTDNYGQIHRSAPSIPTQITVTDANSSISLTIPTLRITKKEGVRLVVYRTEKDGEIFYRTSSLSAPLFNDKTVDTLTFNDTTTDADLIKNDLLYTTGGVIENIAPPAASFCTTYNNRTVLAGLEDPLAFTYSKQKLFGVPTEFTDLFTQRVDPRGGNITALGTLDSYLVIFKRDSIFITAGDGPNDLGQGSFPNPTLVTTDAGCINPNTVVITPKGLMFQSAKGIYLLNRSLQIEYVGAEVEDYNDLTITSSVLMSDNNEVRFITSDDLCLVYNYFFGQWSTFTNHSANDCVDWDNKFVLVRPNGEVLVENKSHFNDAGQPIKLSLTTAWLSFAGIQGYERVYRALFLGEYKSEHKLNIEVGYDYSPYFIDSGVFSVDETYKLNTYGSQTYGEDVYGGEYPLYQIKNHLTRQKFNTVRFRLSDDQLYLTEAGEGFNIANMSFEVGVKRTPRKMSAKNTVRTG